MRVGFDAKRAFANKTGLGNYSRFVLDSLLTYQREIDCLAYTPKNNRNLYPGFPQNAIHLPQSFTDKKLSALWRYATITRQLKKDDIDVYHGLSNEIPQGLRRAGIRSVVTIHDLIFEKLPHLFQPIDRIIYRHKFRFASEKADAVVAVSQQTKRDLVELYWINEDKIKVIYQDCNPVFKIPVDDTFRKEICQLYGINKPYVLCVGTLEERKNQHRLVEAFAALDNKDFNLILIGKQTSYSKKIQETIARYGLSKEVIMLSNVPTAHLPALYQQAEIFAYISIYEGFGIPILEALHSGTPVLSAKGSCLEEAGGPGGLYADPLKTEDIGQQLDLLLTDAPLRDALKMKGKIHVDQFSGEIIAGQLSALYQTLR